jgi:hypothetical protein
LAAAKRFLALAVVTGDTIEVAVLVEKVTVGLVVTGVVVVLVINVTVLVLVLMLGLTVVELLPAIRASFALCCATC